ncbi:D-alanyl-D-alanine carboxypeptidase family protein [Sphingomonas immobilis]|uniref:serine-type D-Ala-D-Ala carboxypeptidase n=1 Tax=Sphingomonas immobilis TaxID=3063997 RepID=A0ABT9A003_9SPHN|nr:D-alanyl-D-alanine carboxypeptidase family protein [Sphingomonas sp. CA1-15]MDO7842704.1 D-alanyl-D-alanine carboxypeptidase family protein [Sphingomonas sp. CA1-15]
MKKFAAASLIAILASVPSMAAAPSYDTPAPVAYLEDVTSGAVLYQKDADRRMPPASMAKMMTVYVAFDMIKKGELKLDQKFHVQPETWRKWHSQGSTMFLSVDEDVAVDDLLKGIVTLSGNDACVVLAEGIAGTEANFTERMNQDAKRLGLTNSHFGTSNGWPDGGVTYVTARDLAKLAKATIKDFPDLYKRFYSLRDFTWGKTLGAAAPIRQDNRDPLLGRVAGADGLKTGHTEEAGYGFTGSAQQGNRRLVMVMAGLGTYGQRAEESVKFMNWGFGSWKSQPVVKKGKKVETAEVQMGSTNKVDLIAPEDLTATLPAGLISNMSLKVVYEGPVKAPIKQGQHIADLVVTSPDMPAQTLPLVAAADVPQAGFFGRVWAGLMSLFGA